MPNPRCRSHNALCEPGRSCGDCLKRIRNPHPRHTQSGRERRDQEKKNVSKPVLKKSATTPTTTPSPATPISPSLEAAYPNLYAYMTQDRWDDGSVRQTATVLFFFERGELKCCLSDRDAMRSAFLTGSDFQALLEAVEMGLEEDGLDWRQKRLAR